MRTLVKKSFLLPLLCFLSFSSLGLEPESLLLSSSETWSHPIGEKRSKSSFGLGNAKRSEAYFQENRTASAYLGLGGGQAGHGGLLGIGLTMIKANNWGGSISIKGNFYRAKNIPKGYSSGIMSLYEGEPKDWTTSYSFMFMRNFPLLDHLRFALEAGPSITTVSVKHFSYSTNVGLFSNNWDYTNSSSLSPGISLRAKLEIPFARFIGFEVASFANINSLNTFAGIEFYLNLGKIRE